MEAPPVLRHVPERRGDFLFAAIFVDIRGPRDVCQVSYYNVDYAVVVVGKWIRHVHVC